MTTGIKIHRQPTVKSYLFTITRNAYLDLWRRAVRHTQLDENMPYTRISAQTQMELSAEVREVLVALQQLPEIDRTVLLMSALDEMPYEEIAETRESRWSAQKSRSIAQD